MTFPLDAPLRTPDRLHGSPVADKPDRRHGHRPSPARTSPWSTLQALTNQPSHSTQHAVEKVGRSITNSETKHRSDRPYLLYKALRNEATGAVGGISGPWLDENFSPDF